MNEKHTKIRPSGQQSYIAGYVSLPLSILYLYTAHGYLCGFECRFIVISTGCIFGGQRKGPVIEQGFHDEHSSLVQNVGSPDDGLIN